LVATEFDKLHFRAIGPATMSGRVADIAVYEADPKIFYVGTAHGGVWKTTSGGALLTPVFDNQGLMSIGDVAVSQSLPDLVYVGEETGANDLVMVPSDAKTLYASTYQRRRTACCMNGGGPGSAIWKSVDEGETWTKLSGGLPTGPLGRIGIDVYRKNPSIVY